MCYVVKKRKKKKNTIIIIIVIIFCQKSAEHLIVENRTLDQRGY